MNAVDSDVFGLAGEVGNCAEALQAALDAAKAHRSKTLFLRAGFYGVESTVKIPSNMAIVCEGNLGDAGGYDQEGQQPSCEIQWTGPDAGIALHLPQCSSNSIKGLSLRGNVNATGTGLAVGNQCYVNADTTQGSDQMTIIRHGGLPLKAGDIVRGFTGIPANTVIEAIDGDTITLNNQATATYSHKGTELFIADGDYPGGYNYQGFAGNHLALADVMIRDFGVNFFAHYQCGSDAVRCNFGNAKEVNVWAENLIHFDWSQIWVGGRELHNPIQDALCFRFIGNTCGMVVRGGEMYHASKVAEIHSAVATFSNINTENIGAGPYFDVTGGGGVEIRHARLAPHASHLNAIPVRCHHGWVKMFASGVVGAPQPVLVQTASGLTNVEMELCGGWQVQELAGPDSLTVVNTVSAGRSANTITSGILSNKVTIEPPNP